MAKVKNRSAELKADLKDSYARWEDLYNNGGSDPNWSDGINMMLVRNHIIYYKRQCEQELRPEEYPEEFWLKLPPEVPKNYMAREDEIRGHAVEFRKQLAEHADYQYLVNAENKLDEKQKKELNFDIVIKQPEWLQDAIDKDDLVRMRRYESEDRYLEQFRKCRRKVEEMLAAPRQEELKLGQLSFFDIYGDMMR